MNGVIDTQRLKNEVEVPTEETLWGKPEIVVPAVVDQVFGDGLALIWISALNTRPAYYVVRVDSVIAIDMDGDPFHDMVDEILEAISDQFGEHNDDHDEDWGVCCEWPALNDSSGVAWGQYRLPGPWTRLPEHRLLGED